VSAVIGGAAKETAPAFAVILSGAKDPAPAFAVILSGAKDPAPARLGQILRLRLRMTSR
jgi:hypothetical protein